MPESDKKGVLTYIRIANQRNFGSKPSTSTLTVLLDSINDFSVNEVLDYLLSSGKLTPQERFFDEELTARFFDRRRTSLKSLSETFSLVRSKIVVGSSLELPIKRRLANRKKIWHFIV